jgi:CRP-like cAMP-binding protein
MVSLEQGRVLIEPGDVAESVYFPHTAVISLIAVMEQGQTVETATFGHSGVVGGVSGLARWRAFARVVVQMPGTASRIPSARFRAAFRESPGLAALVFQGVQSIVVQIQQTAACNALHGVEQRLCRWLLQTQDLAQTNVLPLTQDFLSQMLGVRRSTVTQAACKLHAMGMIRNQRGQIEIVNRAALERAVCECYWGLRSRHNQLAM